MPKFQLTALLACATVSVAPVAHAAPAKSKVKVTQVKTTKPAAKVAPKAATTRTIRLTPAEQRRRYEAAKLARERALKLANQEFLAAIAQAGMNGETIRSTKKPPKTPAETTTP